MKGLSKKEIRFILLSFVSWRLLLFISAFFAIFFIPQFGNRFPYANRVLEITHLPSWIWAFGNFDGVHYLRLAQNGYTAEFTSAFFPLFPILIRIFSVFFPKTSGLDISMYTDPSFFYSGLFLSNILLVAALFVFYKLLSLDHKISIVKKSLFLLLAFPTAFYFGSVYTESLFLFLVVSAIYLIRKNNFFLASLFIAFATATRITGLFLVIVYLSEVLQIEGKINIKKLINPIIFTGLIISLFGILVYSLYLYINFQDPLYFLTVQPKFGAERSNHLVLLPQVMFRYFKIFISVSPLSLSFFNAFLELIFTVFPLLFLIKFYKKIRFSYWVFSIATILLPTLTGTLSSMPRYVLGAFLILPYLVGVFGKSYKIMFIIMVLLQILLVGLFTRGYWVS